MSKLDRYKKKFDEAAHRTGYQGRDDSGPAPSMQEISDRIHRDYGVSRRPSNPSYMEAFDRFQRSADKVRSGYNRPGSMVPSFGSGSTFSGDAWMTEFRRQQEERRKKQEEQDRKNHPRYAAQREKDYDAISSRIGELEKKRDNWIPSTASSAYNYAAGQATYGFGSRLQSRKPGLGALTREEEDELISLKQQKAERDRGLNGYVAHAIDHYRDVQNDPEYGKQMRTDHSAASDPLSRYLRMDEKQRQNSMFSSYEGMYPTGYESHRDKEDDAAAERGYRGSWDQLKPEEINTYYTILQTKGQEAADTYLDDMQTVLNKRQYEIDAGEHRKEFDEAGHGERFWMSAASVPQSLIGGSAQFLDDTVAGFQGKEINPYSKTGNWRHYGSDTREMQAEAFDEATGYNPETGEGTFMGISAGDLYGAGMSVADTLAGRALGSHLYGAMMGMGASAEEAEELYEKGATEDQIKWGAGLAGTAEMVFEDVSLDKIIHMKDPKSLGKLVLNALGQGFIEGSEESVTEAANIITNWLVMQDKSDLVRIYEENGKDPKKTAAALGWQVAKAGILGAISGVPGGFVGSGAKYGEYRHEVHTTGKAINRTQVGTNAILNFAENISKDSSEGAQDNIRKKADAYRKVLEQKNPSGHAANMAAGELRYAIKESISEMRQGELKTALANKGFEEKAADEMAQALEDYSMNRTLSHKQETKVKQGWRNQRVIEAVRSVLYNRDTVSNQKAHKLDKLTIAAAMGDPDFSDHKSDAEAYAPSGKYNIKEPVEGETADGEAFTIASAGNGKMTLQIEDGEIVDSKNAAYPSEDIAIVYEAVGRVAPNVETANHMIQDYLNGDTPARVFAIGIQQGYDFGANGISTDELLTSELTKDLSPAQRATAYKAGQEGGVIIPDSQDGQTAFRSLPADYKGGTVNTDAIRTKDENKWNARQREGMTGLRMAAAASGAEVRVFESFMKDGKRVYIDPDTGKLAVDKDGNTIRAPHGYYKNGRVYVDLNAGFNAEGAILFTVGHEFTHFMREWNPEKYREIADILINYYGERHMSVDEAVQRQMKKAKDDGRTLRYDEALEEWVADSMQTVLRDGKTLEFMAEVRQKDQTLWEKIKGWFADLRQKLQNIVSAYKDATPYTAEAQIVAQAKGLLEKIEPIFAEGLMEAGDNLQGKNTQQEAKATTKGNLAVEEKATTEESTAVQPVTNKMAEAALKDPDFIARMKAAGIDLPPSKAGRRAAAMDFMAQEIVSKTPEKAKFSGRDKVEKTKDLIAVHGLKADDILSVIKLKGLPMPSIAIVKAKDGHNKYGAYSFVFYKDTIDPKADKRNKVYGSDAYTPTASNARTEYEIKYKESSAFDDDIQDLSKKVAGGVFSKSSILESHGVDSVTSSDVKSLAEKLSSDYTVQAAYLASKGKNIEPVYKKKVFDNFGNDALQKYVDKIGYQKLAGIIVDMDLSGGSLDSVAPYVEEIRDMLMEQFIEQHKSRLDAMKPEDRERRLEKRRNNIISDARAFEFIRHAWDYYQGSGSVTSEIDRSATAEKMVKEVNEKDVADWLAPKLKPIYGEVGIYNGKDLFTPSGKSRSFAQTHYAYTAENIVKAMTQTAKARGNIAFGASASSLLSTASPSYKSIDDIKADSGRLAIEDSDDYEAKLEDLDSKISDTISSIVDSNPDAGVYNWEAADIVGTIITEAATGRHTVSAIQNKFKNDSSFTVTAEQAQQILSLYEEAKTFPTGYFEAKPERVVGLDEIAAAVIPDNAPQNVRDALRDIGVNMVEYKPGDDQSRTDALNSIEGVKFSARDDENQISSLRQQIEELEDEAFFTEGQEGIALNKKLTKLRYQLDKMIDAERRAAVRTPLATIIDNLPKYRRSDLESLAEQVSDGAWDDYEEMSRDRLEDALRDILRERMADMSPLEAQLKKNGLDVRPPETESNAVQFQPADAPDAADQAVRFSIREKPAPKNTKKVYKLMRLGNDGNLYPLFIGSNDVIKLNTWYDADSPSFDVLKDLDNGNHLIDMKTGKVIKSQVKNPGKPAILEANDKGYRWMKIEPAKEKSAKGAANRYAGQARLFYNWGINGSDSASTFALRPGWHAGSLPVMDQIGVGANKNLRDDNLVWVEGEIAHDIDYQEEAESNPSNDIPLHLPVDGSYIKGTSSFVTKGMTWYISGAFKANRIISDREARRVIDNFNDNVKDPKAADIHYDWPREGGRVFNAETMQLEPGNESEVYRFEGARDSQKLKKFAYGDDFRFSQRDPQEERKIAVLNRQNEKLKADVKDLNELLRLQKKLTGGKVIDKKSVPAISRKLMKTYDAKGNRAELDSLLYDLYSYISAGNEATWDEVSSLSEKAADWLEEHQQEHLSQYSEEVLASVKGTRVSINDAQRQEIMSYFGSMAEFRKHAGGLIIDQKSNTSLDEWWQEMAGQYPGTFDQDTNDADMPTALSDAVDGLRQQNDEYGYSPYDLIMGHRDLIREVYDTYWDANTLLTVADQKQAKIDALTEQVRSGKITMKERDRQIKEMEKEAKKREASLTKDLRKQYQQDIKNLLRRHKTAMDAAETFVKQQIRELKAEAKADQKAIKEQMRADANAKVDATAKRYQEKIKAGTEGRRKTQVRHKLQKVVKQLSDLLLNGTKERHVPTSLQGPVALMLDMLSMDTVNADQKIAEIQDQIAKLRKEKTDFQNQLDTVADAKKADRLHKSIEVRDKNIAAAYQRIENLKARDEKLKPRLQDLHEAYSEIAESTDPMEQVTYDPVIDLLIRNVKANIGDATLSQLNTDQMENLYQLYKALLKTVRDANKAHSERIRETVEAMGKNVINEIRSVGGQKTGEFTILNTIRKYGWQNLRPAQFFKILGSSTLNTLYQEMRAGEDTYAVDIADARAFRQEMVRKYHADRWNTEKLYHFTDVSGKGFDLNLQQIMSIYAYVLRGEQAMDHMNEGGIVLGPDTKHKRKVLGIDFDFQPNGAEAYRLGPEFYMDMHKALAENAGSEQYAKEMQKYLSTVMGAKGNEVSRALYDMDLFKEENYFPLRSAADWMARAASSEELKSEGFQSIKNKGMTKQTTPHAGNPIMLSGFDTVWAEHVDDMSIYHALTLPMEDFNRVYAYHTDYQDDNPGAVVATITSAYGKEPNNYIKEFIRQANGGVRKDPNASLMSRHLSKFKKTATMLSLSVMAQQHSAIYRAMAVIDPKYFAVKIPIKDHAAMWEELKHYAPVAIIKEMGGFDVGSSGSTTDYLLAKEYTGAKEKGKALLTDSQYRDEAMGRGPGYMDEVGWLHIWQAAKKQAMDNNPGKSHEEQMKAAANIFTRAVTETQVYDSVFSRSGLMRSKDTGLQMATAFMAEPTVTANMVADAIVAFRRGNKAILKRTLGSIFLSTVANAAAAALVYAARDDDDDETYVEKYAEAALSKIAEGLNPLTYLPIARDVMSLLQGYDIERSDMAVLADLVKSIQNVTSDKKTPWQKIRDFSGSFAGLFGLPLKNVLRDGQAIYNLFAINPGKTTGAGLRRAAKEAVLPSWLGFKPDDKAEILYDAVMSGDKEEKRRAVAQYKTEEAAHAALRKQLKLHDDRIEKAAKLKLAGDAEGFKRLFKQIQTEGNFSFDDIMTTINSVISELKPKEEPKAPNPKTEAFRKEYGYTWSDRDELYLGGGITREQLIKAYADIQGKDMDDAEEAVDSWINKTELSAQYPDLEITESFASRYTNIAAPAGIDIYTYAEYRELSQDLNKADDMALIDSLPLSVSQKDALYLSHGNWSRNKLYEAPWH